MPEVKINIDYNLYLTPVNQIIYWSAIAAGGELPPIETINNDEAIKQVRLLIRKYLNSSKGFAEIFLKLQYQYYEYSERDDRMKKINKLYGDLVGGDLSVKRTELTDANGNTPIWDDPSKFMWGGKK